VEVALRRRWPLFWLLLRLVWLGRQTAVSLVPNLLRTMRDHISFRELCISLRCCCLGSVADEVGVGIFALTSLIGDHDICAVERGNRFVNLFDFFCGGWRSVWQKTWTRASLASWLASSRSRTFAASIASVHIRLAVRAKRRQALLRHDDLLAPDHHILPLVRTISLSISCVYLQARRVPSS